MSVAMPEALRQPMPKTIVAVFINQSMIVVMTTTLKLPIALTSVANVINQSMPTSIAELCKSFVLYKGVCGTGPEPPN